MSEEKEQKMGLQLDRVGKMALFASLTTREEEEVLKSLLPTQYSQFKVGVTFLAGTKNDVLKNISKAVIMCAVQNGVIKKAASPIHAVIHAALEALGGIVDHIPADTSLKLKVAVCSDNEWVAVALYGDSAVHPLTNHERVGLGIMHL